MTTLTKLKYGPIGDPDSTDIFERAQARAPHGWHVEGQAFGLRMRASGPNAEGVHVWAYANEGPDELVAEMQRKAAEW